VVVVVVVMMMMMMQPHTPHRQLRGARLFSFIKPLA